jgi:hypothetical protein
VGRASLLATVIGSGIMEVRCRRQRRRGAAGHGRAALVALILMFGPMSGGPL